MPVNLDKPRKWKADIIKSVDMWISALSHDRGLDVRDVPGPVKRCFDVPGGLDTCGAECLRREFHKPLVVPYGRV